MEALLNLSDSIDVSLLDQVVTIMYQGAGPEQKRAQTVLSQLQEHPDAWQRVDRILETSRSPATRYFAVQILEKLVQARWNALPRPQCEGIKNYIVGLIIRTSSDESAMQSERVYLNKLNLLLVQILKHEWPKNWPTFISELVGASRTSLSLCENNMGILRLLSEEVFDYSAEQMTTLKAKNLKTQLCGEFAEVFQLCSEVLEHASRPSLILATLEALLKFLKWIPLGYIFETSVIELLAKKYLVIPTFRNVTVGCLTEMAALQVGSEYDQQFVQCFELSIAALRTSLLPYRHDANFGRLWEDSSDSDQKFIQNLAIFLSTMLSGHIRALEAAANPENVTLAHLYLLKISSIDDREIFKVCLEYWNRLVSGLYSESPYLSFLKTGSTINNNSLVANQLLLSPSTKSSSTSSRRVFYKDICSQLRLVMIERMVKPEEVLIVEDENGNIVREQIKETDTITLYKGMREVLVFLTHLDVDDTERVMTGKLARQIDGSEWSWQNLNKLCWAVGSVSGAMNEEVEKRFLVTVIRDLLGLVELKRGKDNKAVVAANIMYVVGQYPRFLKAHWKFLKTVVNKLFEFMHELHEGVQDMACDTFIKIVRKCRRHFVFCQPAEDRPFVEEIIERLPMIICDLQPSQVHTFYKAVGCMLEAEPHSTNASASNSCQHLSALMALPNESWDAIISACSVADSTNNSNTVNTSINSNTASNCSRMLQDIDTLRTVSNILKTNIATCSTAGPFAFLPQLSRIFLDMLSVYRNVSGLISDAVQRQGVIATKTPVIRAMRTVKKDCLRLMQQYIEGTGNSTTSNTTVNGFADSFAPALFEAILSDYRMNIPAARDAEVLAVTAAVVEKLGDRVSGQVEPILETVFEPTLSMISQDFSDFPDHRSAFFKLLRAINAKCFPSLLKLSPARFKLTIDSVVWAFKHTHRDISETGLWICLELLENFDRLAPKLSSDLFYAPFYLSLLQDLFVVLCDSDHKAAFKLHAAILAHLFRILVNNKLVCQFSPTMDNPTFVRQFCINLLSNAYGHLQRVQIETFVKGLFDLNSNSETFKAHLKDFLISLREFASPDDLFQEEAELEMERKRQVELEASLNVPGIIKPADLDEEDDAVAGVDYTKDDE